MAIRCYSGGMSKTIRLTPAERMILLACRDVAISAADLMPGPAWSLACRGLIRVSGGEVEASSVGIDALANSRGALMVVS
jgi:hypothetical protein